MMLRLPALATACVLAAALLYWLAGVLGAQHKLAALEPLPPRANYAVTLAFPPERFHQLRLQDKGRVVEVRERTVYIMDMSPAALHDVAREYWVDTIVPWAGR
ncbi:MAG: hypothetical protein H0T80_18625 [Betaproteobacteria bacterium]|nr:hypothetical protein [Betaproteobacteria bacterium]